VRSLHALTVTQATVPDNAESPWRAAAAPRRLALVRVLSLDQLGQVLSSLGTDDPRVVASGNFAAPQAVLDVLDSTVERFRLCLLNAQPGIPDRDGITLETVFVGDGMRKSPRLRYVPCRLSLAPLLHGTTLRPDVVVVHTSMPRDGTVSLGIEVNVMPAAIEAARMAGGTVIAQANARMPYTFGDAVLPVDELDYLVEVDEPLASPVSVPIDDVSQSIGDRVASRVLDGSSLQMGIGAVPDATLHALTGRTGLRIWSEMFSDGVLALERAGALDPGWPLVASFLFGSPELYEWVDRNPRVRMLRTERTNEPAAISRNPRVVSVNTAIQVDLFAQANASRIHNKIYSGFGGQTDFIVGALHSQQGQAIIALRSWHRKAHVSTIVPLIDEPLTSFQHSAVITENGVAEIWGNSQTDQAEQLIENCAHPDVREELWEEAQALGLTAG
jgi:acyl-CoA hydrolase